MQGWQKASTCTSPSWKGCTPSMCSVAECHYPLGNKTPGTTASLLACCFYSAQPSTSKRIMTVYFCGLDLNPKYIQDLPVIPLWGPHSQTSTKPPKGFISKYHPMGGVGRVSAYELGRRHAVCNIFLLLRGEKFLLFITLSCKHTNQNVFQKYVLKLD